MNWRPFMELPVPADVIEWANQLGKDEDQKPDLKIYDQYGRELGDTSDNTGNRLSEPKVIPDKHPTILDNVAPDIIDDNKTIESESFDHYHDKITGVDDEELHVMSDETQDDIEELEQLGKNIQLPKDVTTKTDTETLIETPLKMITPRPETVTRSGRIS